MWSTVTGESLCSRSGYSNGTPRLWPAPDGSWVAADLGTLGSSSEYDLRSSNDLVVWKPPTGPQPLSPPPVGFVWALAGALDGSWLAASYGNDDRI